jgi:hypothetical protein
MQHSKGEVKWKTGAVLGFYADLISDYIQLEALSTFIHVFELKLHQT